MLYPSLHTVGGPRLEPRATVDRRESRQWTLESTSVAMGDWSLDSRSGDDVACAVLTTAVLRRLSL